MIPWNQQTDADDEALCVFLPMEAKARKDKTTKHMGVGKWSVNLLSLFPSQFVTVCLTERAKQVSSGVFFLLGGGSRFWKWI